MTVRELMEILRLRDPDAPVVVYTMSRIGGRWQDAEGVSIIPLAPKANGVYPQFRDLGERNTVRAVALE